MNHEVGVPDVLRIVQVGLGPIGRSLALEAARRPGMVLAGAADPRFAGTRLAVKDAAGRTSERTVAGELEQVLEETRPDVAILATGSFLADVADPVLACLRRGAHVVSTCEELVYPFLLHPALSEELDAAARRAERTVLGVGVNPGFVLDHLPAVLGAACLRIHRIFGRRVVDLARRREPLLRKMAVGEDPGAMDGPRRPPRPERLGGAEAWPWTGPAPKGLGHVGLDVSGHLLREVLGFPPEAPERRGLDVLVAAEPVEAGDVRVPVGRVCGLRQRYACESPDGRGIELELVMQVSPPDDEDLLSIEGDPSFSVRVPGGLPGDAATVALALNAAAAVPFARPGLRTVLDVGLRFRG